MEIIGAAGVPAGAVLDTLELYNDPTFEQRQIMQTIQHPTVWSVQDGRLAGALRGQAAAGEAVAAARRNNDEVLHDWLGLDRDAVGGLRNGGVIG